MLLRLLRQLDRPLFGTVVVPADARVDPRDFPEAAFPVRCPRCDYLLQGLPEPRCPECGEPFDRGRLLVQQYVEPHRKPDRRRRLGALAVCILLLVVSKPVGVILAAVLGASMNVIEVYHRVAGWIEILLLVVICVWLGNDLRQWSKLRRQRRAIVEHLVRHMGVPSTATPSSGGPAAPQPEEAARRYNPGDE